MSAGKRSATSELNHDNWDEDVEPEEAGKFSQADESTLKGRVIKKAKRRGLQATDGAPSVFAGFGGFKAAPSGGSSFDFLSKPSNGTTNTGFGTGTGNPGFVFGNTNNTNTAPATPATFSFGSKSAATNNGNGSQLDNGTKNEDTDTADTSSSTKTNIFQFGSKQNTSSPSIFGGATNKPFAIKSGLSSPSTSARDTTKADTSVDTTKTSPITKKSEEIVTPEPERVSDEEIKRVASNSKEFLTHLSALNKQFFEWIDQHIKKNPYILISPCIRDYEKHLAQLTKEYADKKDTDKDQLDSSSKNDKEDVTTPPAEKQPEQPAAKGLLSGIFGNPASTSTKPTTGNFTFGSSNQTFTFGQEKKPDSTVSTESSKTSGFSFGNPTTGASSGGFTFGGSTTAGSTFGSGSMFGQAAAAAMQAKKDNENADAEETEEDQPPKVEIKQVVEDDAIHSVRCKLFYMKNKEFADKGLGMLYLKKVNESEENSNAKTQLLVRAETNLGNILLNIMLSKQMNLEKRKNCVQFVCIPNPEITGITSGSPVTMLVKVKNVDQASILEDEMKKRIELL